MYIMYTKQIQNMNIPIIMVMTLSKQQRKGLCWKASSQTCKQIHVLWIMQIAISLSANYCKYKKKRYKRVFFSVSAVDIIMYTTCSISRFNVKL